MSTEDEITNPPHYTQGSIECIEAIKAALTPEEFDGCCKANAIKYIWRMNHKGNRQDNIKKAIRYLEMLLEDNVISNDDVEINKCESCKLYEPNECLGEGGYIVDICYGKADGLGNCKIYISKDSPYDDMPMEEK